MMSTQPTATIEGPIVLVCHSHGGAVISQAAEVADLVEKTDESVGAAFR
jgi:predicted alpha/beta hydrolase family esterase